MDNLRDLLKFTELTVQFRGVERGVHLLHEKRKENDAEHSFQLALIAWYIISERKLDLDIGKVLKYSIAHDLVEVYAGDTPLLSATPEMFANKAKREEEAHKKLEKEFPHLTDMYEAMHAYETRVDDEAKLVYALDKLLPSLVVYLDKGYSWKINKASLSSIIHHKTDKIALSPVIKEYFDELMEILKKHEKEYFG